MRIQRSSLRFEGAHELSQERRLLVQTLNGIGRAGRGLLIDSRVAPHSTDERLQEEFRRFRLEVASGFERVASVVRTKVGMLQVHRLCADQAVSVHPFDNEAAAIAFLLSELPDTCNAR